ncbi:MAG: M42 family peptidase [Planctomycetes bacterium]|nr:M42 family peptidase [Planctomycetota bacterium]NOG52974.1 M42 family metallopeptidase [Planctomycetota bacterium]
MNTDLLKRLCETPGIPGREERVRALIESEVKGLFDEVTVDPLGSLICVRKPTRTVRRKKGTSPLRVMLACHMDEIGFYVRHIDDQGFIWVQPAGGFDTRNLFSRRVLVCTDSGDIPAIMNPGGKPVHIASAEDRKKVPDTSEFFIDLGMSAAKVKKAVSVGDMIVMNEPFMEAGDTCVSKAMDNRVACWLGIEAVRQLASAKKKKGKPGGHACEIHCVFTVQEEVGLRGAITSAYTVKPDVGIGIDVTLCCDTPGVTEVDRVTKQGDGVALTMMDSASISNHELVREFEKVARSNKIPWQRSILPRGGTDAAALQRAASGARAITVSVGTRYIHTVTEMVHRKDLESARDLLAAYLAQA